MANLKDFTDYLDRLVCNYCGGRLNNLDKIEMNWAINKYIIITMACDKCERGVEVSWGVVDIQEI